MLVWCSPKSRKSLSAPNKILLLATLLDISWVWGAFLTLLLKFQCDLGAYACCSHICRNGHMSNLFHSFLCGFCQSLAAWPTDRSRETCCISINANCAALRFRCSTLICVQAHRKTRSANEFIWQGGNGATAGSQLWCSGSGCCSLP